MRHAVLVARIARRFVEAWHDELGDLRPQDIHDELPF